MPASQKRKTLGNRTGLAIPVCAAFVATALCLARGSAGSGVEGRLHDSDLEESAGISLFLAPHAVEVTDSEIIVLSEWTKTIEVFDLEGRFLGGFDWEPEWRQSRGEGALGPQARLRIETGRMLLSLGDVVLVWRDGTPAPSVHFDLPVSIVKSLPDRLIFERTGEATLLGIGDYQGNLLRSFGQKLDLPEADERTNEFFAAASGEEIFILFKYYPVYRVYSLTGDLLREGQYQLPSQAERHYQRMNADPPPSAPKDELFPIIRALKYFKGNLYVNFNLCEIGILPVGDFKLVHTQDICRGNPNPPLLVAFDPVRDRFLAMTKSIPGAGSGIRLSWLPIAERGDQ